MDWNQCIVIHCCITVHQLGQNYVEKLKIWYKLASMLPLDSNEGGHCSLLKFARFPKKVAVDIIGGGASMVNQKNAVEISAFKCNFGSICGL